MTFYFLKQISFYIYFWDPNSKTLCVNIVMKDKLSKFLWKTIISGSYSLQQNQCSSWAPKQFSIRVQVSVGVAQESDMSSDLAAAAAAQVLRRAEIEGSSPLFNHSMVLISYSL